MFSIKALIIAFIFNITLSAQISKIPGANDALRKAGISPSEANSILLKEGIDLNNISNSKNLIERDSKQGSTNINNDFNKNFTNQINLENKSSINSIAPSNSNDSLITNIALTVDTPDSDANILVEVKKEKIEAEYFGYNIFSSSPDIFEKSFDESVDPGYLIGPGDEIIIMMWGETEFQNTYTVSRDGYLFISNVGQVFVNGLTLGKLENKLFRVLKKVYASLDNSSGSATTYFDVSLGGLVLRPLRVFVLGNVDQPGAYAVKPSTTLFTSLYYFNGPNTNGSLRTIKLIRNNDEIAEIDFYDYLLTGKQVDDIRLQRDDVIFIPPIGKVVEVRGSVDKFYKYEMKQDEGLSSLINMIGGLSNTVYMKRAQIDRVVSPDKRSILGYDRTILDIDLSSLMKNDKNFSFHDGDVLTLFEISQERENYISISGPVKRPGYYDLGNGLSLKSLILKSDGLLGDVYPDRVDVIRTNEDQSLSQLDFNLSKIMQGDKNENIFLQSRDSVIVYTYSDMKWVNDVSISGHVLNPGKLPFREGMQIIDLVFSGGGFENEKFLEETYLNRADLYRLDSTRKKYKIIPFRLDSVLAGKGLSQMKLEMGDEIKIYSRSDIFGEIEQIVSIKGFVKRPGKYRLYNGLTIKELIFLAGGFEDDVHLNNAILNRADLTRTDPISNLKEIIVFDLAEVLSTNDSKANFQLFAGDEVRIYSKDMFQDDKNVTINGDVKNPGQYSLKNNMVLKDLILESGGIIDNVKSFKVEIARKKQDSYGDIYAQLIEFKLINSPALLELNNGKIDFKLNHLDQISIIKSPENTNLETVSVSGFVNYPGDYIISKKDEKVTSILKRAGGLRAEAYPRASILIRNGELINVSFSDIIKNKRSKYNFSVIGGDSIVIGSKPNLVKLVGEFNSPGNYQYTPGYRIRDYIELAGGLSDKASNNGIFVKYPDGKSKQYFKYRTSPKVYDGSVITALPIEESEPFSLTQYITNLTTFWADLSQAYLMLVIALRSS